MLRAMVRILGLLLVLAQGPLGFGQIILQGKVVNAEKEIVEFANVSLFLPDSSILLTGATTDANGQYDLQLSRYGTYHLTISRIGYEDFSETLVITKSGFIGEQQLLSSKYLLEEITVTAERGIIENTNGRIVFKVEQSPCKSGFDGLELLQKLPGILTDAENNLSMNGETLIVQITGRAIQ